MARLAFRVLGARLRRDRYGSRVSSIGIKLFGAARFFYRLAELVMAELLPMLFLACGPTVARTAAAAFFAQGSPKLGGADGAFREDHRTASLLGFGQPHAVDASPRACLIVSSDCKGS